jgi:hypothetical protein
LGLGAAGAGAALVGFDAGPAGASPSDGLIGPAGDGRLSADAVTPLPGAVMGALSLFDFLPLELGTAPAPTAMRYTTAGRLLEPSGFLVAPMDMPVGAELLQVDIFGNVAAGSQIWVIGSLTVPATTTAGALAQVFLAVGDTTAVLTPPPGTTVAAGERYFIQCSSNTNQYVTGAIYQYLPPAARPVTTIEPARVYDSRAGGGKLGEAQQRTISVANDINGIEVVPFGATGAVITLTVTLTEGDNGGFVAAFPAGVAWPGTSSVNWFGPNQNLAATVVVALGGDRQITLRGGVAPTDVIVDVTGYLL